MPGFFGVASAGFGVSVGTTGSAVGVGTSGDNGVSVGAVSTVLGVDPFKKGKLIFLFF